MSRHPEPVFALLGLSCYELCTFGMRSSAVLYFLVLVLRYEGVLLLFHYLNDFFIFGPLGVNIASTPRLSVEVVLRVFSAPIAKHKTQGLSTCITFFLGIIINTVLLQLMQTSIRKGQQASTHSSQIHINVIKIQEQEYKTGGAHTMNSISTQDKQTNNREYCGLIQ